MAEPEPVSDQIRKNMTPEAPTIERSATVAEAIERLSEGPSGPLSVVEAGKVVGVVAARDIVDRVLGKGDDPSSVSVGTIATNPVVMAKIDQGMEAAEDLVGDHDLDLDHIIIVEEDDSPAGTLSAADLIKWHRVS
jgi:CBS domain-containing protein